MTDYAESTWWSPRAGEEAHDLLVRLYRDERQAQAGHYRTLRAYAACYELGYGDGVQGLDGAEPSNPERMFFNAAANALDTWVAAVAGTRVVPQATVERGNYGQRSRAEMVNRGLEAVWDACDVETRKVECVRDYGITGLGAVWIYADDDEVTVQPIDPLDVLVDRAESRLGAPRCIYLRVPMDRGQVLARFAPERGAREHDDEETETPEDGFVGSREYRRAQILECPQGTFDDWTFSGPDQIEVIVGYHLPSAKGADDGKVLIAIESCALVERPWTRQRFPVEVYRAKRSRRGYWGVPLMRSLYGAQREFEKLTARIELAHHRMGGAHFLVEGGSASEEVCDVRSLSNGQGTVIHVRDGKVRDWTPTPVNPETVRYHASIPDGMLRYNGLSPYAASGQVPAGITGSGEAQRVYQDTSNQRLVEAHRELERWTLGVADLIIDAIEDVVSAHGSYVVRHASIDGFSEVDWSELIKDRDSFKLRLDPINFLAQTPAAKYARLDSWLNAQIIDPATYKRLTGAADIQAETMLETSDAEIIDKTIETILDRGEEIMPEPTDNLALVLSRGARWVNVLRLRSDVGPERLDLVRRYVADAQALLARGSTPPPAADPGAEDPAAIAQAQADLAAATAPSPAVPPGSDMAGMPPGALPQ